MRKLPWIAVLVALLGFAGPVHAQDLGWPVAVSGGLGRTHLSGDDIRTQEGLASFQVTGETPLADGTIRFSYRHTDRELATLRRVTVGWLMQFGSGHWRPFLEPGWTFARQSPGAVAARRLTGPHLSAGLTVDLSERFFLRPEVAADLHVPGPMLLREGWLAVGFRF